MFDADGEIGILTCVLIGLAVGAVVGAGYGAISSYAKTGKVSLKKTLICAGIGGAIGAVLGAVPKIALALKIGTTGGVGIIQAINQTVINNTKLQNWVNEYFRKAASIGNGSLADAIRYERIFGKLVGGKSHILKGIERLAGLLRIINTQSLSPEELNLARKLYGDLLRASKGLTGKP